MPILQLKVECSQPVGKGSLLNSIMQAVGYLALFRYADALYIDKASTEQWYVVSVSWFTRLATCCQR